MIAFGSAVTAPDTYESYAAPGIRLAAEPDSEVMAHAADGSLFRNYNLLLDRAAEFDDLEALVIVHQDTEIVDPQFCAKVREALADPQVGLAGCVGAIGVRSIAWWEGSVTWASFTHRYPESEFGGGEFPGFAWVDEDKPPYARVGEVDSVDGFLMVLAPWTVREVRFDESLGKIHGYDFDFCLQVREAGRKVVTADLRVVHHHSLTLIGDPDVWVEGHMRVAEKWDGRMPNVGSVGGDWKQRARRAEAEAAVLRNQFVSAGLHGQAHAKQL
ncbi:MAG: hypothetical protein GEU88_19195, partial [Solirubrobacterales bacterium]|nr:hypothetical protein [Solirubrobacterales bacterium]